MEWVLMTQLWRKGAVELSTLIKQGRISAREAVASALARVEQVNPKINAVVDLMPEQAFKAADEVDQALAKRAQGRSQSAEPLGELLGVPVTVKVNVDTKGRATTNGVVAYQHNIATDDSPVVANLRAAGAIIIGRTNTPAFSMRWFTENDLYGRTMNPWSKDHTPGGSSGGASAAVAAGIGAIGHGNDFGGSVRYPAYCTGLYGLRPSFGRVPGFLPSAPVERAISAQWMSVQGPLTRNVTDLKAALHAMSIGDYRDVWWVPAPHEWPPASGPIRVAVTFSSGGADLQPEVLGAIKTAASWLSDAGYQLEEVDPPGMTEAAQLWDTLAQNDVRYFLADAIKQHADAGMRRALEWMLEKTPELNAKAYSAAAARRSTLLRDWLAFMTHYPLILGPVSAHLPFAQGRDTASRESMHDILAAQAPMFFVPLLGVPALSAPVCIAEGVPIGVQLIASRFREDMLFDAAQVIEDQTAVRTPIDPKF